MSQGGGNYQTTNERTMAAYDKLPPSARMALQEARGYKTGPEGAERVKEFDAKELGKRKYQR